MLSENQLMELDELLYFMSVLEKIKKATNKNKVIESKKITFLLETTVDQIILRCEKIYIKINKESSCQEEKIAAILLSISNNWVQKWPILSNNELYSYDREAKKYNRVDKYPTIDLWGLIKYILFFKKEIESITRLDGVFGDGSNGMVELLKLYSEDIEYQKEIASGFLEMLDDRKKEYLKLIKVIKKKERILKTKKSNKKKKIKSNPENIISHKMDFLNTSI